MRRRVQKRFIAHCDKYFRQTGCTVLPPKDRAWPHIDSLLYPPNEVYPFWKLVTMGASDIKMPKHPISLARRNEYMMFIDPSEDLTQSSKVGWYHRTLLDIARHPAYSKTSISYCNSLEWEPGLGSDMVAAFLELPQMITDPMILLFKRRPLMRVVCLQVILLTRQDVNMMKEIGNQEYSHYLYPEDETIAHFLAERYRSERF